MQIKLKRCEPSQYESSRYPHVWESDTRAHRWDDNLFIREWLKANCADEYWHVSTYDVLFRSHDDLVLFMLKFS